MGEYFFGAGPGWLSARVEKAAKAAAKAAGAEALYSGLTNTHDTGCSCGLGCRPYSCRASRRHWFSVRNRGAPFDSQLALEIMAAVEAAATKADKELFDL